LERRLKKAGGRQRAVFRTDLPPGSGRTFHAVADDHLDAAVAGAA
jgi:hypothetical protein